MQKKAFNLRHIIIAGLLSAGSFLAAQTSGPTTPEFTSFEPVDANDLVNISSGDLVYTIPLLEVPGPEGGYPVALSYHAGIMPFQEASWVGLGWTLNVGSISRTINGFPDDANAYNKDMTDRTSIGETHIYSIGVGFGVGIVSVNVGIDIANDTYRGIGVGGSVGFGSRIGSSPVGIGVTVGVGPYGGGYASAGISVSTGQAQSEAVSGSISLGISTNFESVSGYMGGGISYHKTNGQGETCSMSLGSMGVSLSSEGLKGNVSVAGVSISAVNSKAGRISTVSYGGNVSIPLGYLPVSINLGYHYTRYWSYEIGTLLTYGTLYAAEAADEYQSGDINDNASFDCYSIDVETENSFENKIDDNPDQNLGGSLPAYDYYNVMGQGISGSIQPYILEDGFLFRQSLYDDNESKYPVEYYGTPEGFQKPVNFRFVNDFSNNYLQGYPDLTISASGLTISIDGDSVGHVDPPSEYSNIDLINTANNHLAGSKHVKWYSNKEIHDGDAYLEGFVSYESNTFDNRSTQSNMTGIIGNTPAPQVSIEDQIGGFMITNESGLTYHYSLPVYDYHEFSYIDCPNEDAHPRHLERDIYPKATAWLLTAITGPDYVDDFLYNTSTKAPISGEYGPSEGDYGYWIKFEYGKWTDNFLWKTPGNKNYDMDLEKKRRVVHMGTKEIYYLDAIHTRSHTAIFVKKLREDGKSISSYPFDDAGFSYDLANVPDLETGFGYDFSGNDVPVSLLALDNIILIENSQLAQINGGSYEVGAIRNISSHEKYNVVKPVTIDGTSYYKLIHNGQGVVDIEDVKGSTSEELDINYLYDKALRVIRFNTDYSLCPGTPNSFETDELYTAKACTTFLGKLTLNSLEFKGKGDQCILPPMEFFYGTTQFPDGYTGSYSADVIDGNGKYNPAYHADKYDMWHMYKVDIDHGGATENIKRMVTETSAQFLDAWSLTELKTSLGSVIKVYYQPSEYSEKGILSLDHLPVNSIAKTSQIDLEADITISPVPTDCQTYFTEGMDYRFVAILLNFYNDQGEEDYTVYKFLDCPVQVSYVAYNETTKKITLSLAINSSLHDFLKYAYENIEGKTYQATQLISGEIYHDDVIKKGSGIRVSKIEVSNLNRYFITEYQYNGGATTYEPIVMDDNYPRITQFMGISIDDTYEKEYKRAIHAPMKKLFRYNRFIPAPGVLYSNVSLYEKVKNGDAAIENIPGYKEYNFETFSFERDIKINGTFKPHATDPDMATITIQNMCNRVGNLMSSVTYGKDNVPLSQTTNIYAYQEGQDYDDVLDYYYNQGLITQVFHEYRQVDLADHQKKQVIATKLIEYPNFQVKSLYVNRKNNLTDASMNIKFDFLTGQAVSVLSNDSYNNYLLSEATPAYLLTDYKDMGPRVVNHNAKNMLTQAVQNTVYKLDNSLSKTGLISSTVTTWLPSSVKLGTENYTAWRKTASYVFTGNDATTLNTDGTYPLSSFESNQFASWLSLPSDAIAQWQRTGTVYYNEFSRVVEALDINNVGSAVLMDHEKKRVIAAASNARLSEIHFNSFEPYENLVGSTAFAHTGQYAYLLYDNAVTIKTFTAAELNVNKQYRASVWCYRRNDVSAENASLSVSGGATSVLDLVTPQPEKKAGSWYLLEVLFTPDGSGNNINISLDCLGSTDYVHFDDFRVQPVDAEMLCYVYNLPWSEIEYILDNQNFFIHYAYGNDGKLIRISKEMAGATTEIRVSEQAINYGLSPCQESIKQYQ